VSTSIPYIANGLFILWLIFEAIDAYQKGARWALLFFIIWLVGEVLITGIWIGGLAK